MAMSEYNNPIENDYMVTTYDNPYDPFMQFNLWFKYDMMLGHNCCGILNETANVNSVQSENLNEKDVEDAIDYIVKQNPTIYKKVSKLDSMKKFYESDATVREKT